MASLQIIIGLTAGLTALLTVICVFLRKQQAPRIPTNQSTKDRFQQRGNDNNSAIATAVGTTVAAANDSALKNLQMAVGSSPEKLRALSAAVGPPSPNRMRMLQSL